ncbi:MAG: hypothetical protein ACC628_11745 [Pirellulaceae bacterium]
MDTEPDGSTEPIVAPSEGDGEGDVDAGDMQAGDSQVAASEELGEAEAKSPQKSKLPTFPNHIELPAPLGFRVFVPTEGGGELVLVKSHPPTP